MKAFPSATGAVGMELRDYFAAKAMQAQVNNPLTISPGGETHRIIAEKAYLMADAMMKARDNHDV